MSEHHFEAADRGECRHCGEPTAWIEVTFQAWLCPGACTEAKWLEYDRLCEEHAPLMGTPFLIEDDPFKEEE